MEPSAVDKKTFSSTEFLAGGGEMGQRIREFDWSKTPLGPIDTWPRSLRTCIRIMLTSRQPMWIGWGKELIKLYNDPYKAIVGGKHPWALGAPASLVWKDIWKDIQPMLQQVMEKDEGTYVESQLLIMERNGYPEETYYTFSYTPIPGDDGGTAGMICANTDDTDRIISERQLTTLTQLGKNLTDCKTNREVIEKTIASIGNNPHDFPFALFYITTGHKAILCQSTNLGAAAAAVPAEIDLNAENEIAQLLTRAAAQKKLHVFDKVKEKVGDMPKGGWEIEPDKAIILPIVPTGAQEPYGFLVVGFNPFRLLDEKFKGFLSLLADQVATSFADIHVLEEERKRAEALAEIDRAKTIFFSNISHEFRTPLTLLLGPIEDVLNDPETHAANRRRMEVANRNALRMQKLVNTLLDFSRIEAGRVEGRYSPVDICSFTQDLASTFRSAIEKAGMQLHFQCQEIKEEVYVDVDMWEKIVLNLVSNAFKYCENGSIEVTVRQVEQQVQLLVSDTGIGIPDDQLQKIFNRFHRIENREGRSQEGTGIGLAMVKELVKFHQGSISVTSQLGKGSTFTVSIPVGKEHLPADKIVTQHIANPVSKHSVAFVEEALKWLPGTEHKPETNINKLSSKEIIEPSNNTNRKLKVLLADDNADMREYVQRLLSARFEVITSNNGEDAFAKTLHFQPDLLLSDIMMPKLDGFGLIQKVRSHPDTRNVPVIFLSARAGQEAKVEGLNAGADDYLVKPFSAKELIATVTATIKIAQSRKAAENNLKNVIMQTPVAMCIFRGKNWHIDIANQKAVALWGKTHEAVINKPAFEVFPELIEQNFDKIFLNVYTTGRPFIASEMPVTFVRQGKADTLFVNVIIQPLKIEDGKIDGLISVAIDVTEQVQARKKIEHSQRELNELANAMPQLVWVANPEGTVIYYNKRVAEFAGAKQTENGNWSWEGLLHPDDLVPTERAWKEAIEKGTVYQIEHRAKMADGTYRWMLSRGWPQKDEKGNILKWFGTATDIQASKEQATVLEEEVKKRTHELNELNVSLQQSNNDLQQFAHVASHDLKEPLRKIKTFTSRLHDDEESRFSDKAKTYINKINSATDRMFAMIEGVLNYSMLNASEQKIEPVNLNEVMKNIETDLELLIIQKSASIVYQNLPTIEGAAVLQYQLFYNLINNSLKFSKPDVPTIISLSSSIIKKNQKEFAEIKLEDNGIGFEQEYAEKIFDTFARLNSKDRYEGTGLGLSLCKRIVQRHGGSIEAFGKKNAGAVFVIQLPLQQQSTII